MIRLIAAGLVAVGSASVAFAQDTMSAPPPPPPPADATAPSSDLPPPPPPPPPPASTALTDGVDWTGLYVGVHGGYGIDNDKPVTDRGITANNNFAITNNIRPSTLKVSRAGILGGGQVGYLRQFNKWIVGAEADFSYMDNGGLTDYRSPATVTTFPRGRRTRISNDLDWMGSVRARAGYALGAGQIYATGGYAFGRIRGSATFYGDNDNQINYAGRHKYTAQGWTAGGGFEFKPFAYQAGMMSKISVRGELLYYDLGRSTIFALQTGTQPGYYVVGKDTRGFNGRVGINYHF